MPSKWQAISLMMTFTFLACLQPVGLALAGDISPFQDLAGRWVGDGTVRLRNGDNVEPVTCRATYFVLESANELKQNIRCASARIEVTRTLVDNAGQLTG